MGAAASPSSRVAVTETRVRALFNPTIKMRRIDNHGSPCSVRVYGPVVISRETRVIGDTRSRSEDPDAHMFDYRMEVDDPSLFRSHEACRDLIHRMLAEGAETGEYDLAAGNWEEFEPDKVATTIIAAVRRGDTESRCGAVPAYAFVIQMPLEVRLIYREPNKALLLACKDKDAAAKAKALARRRKRRREPAGELCAICLSDFKETEEEETARLPCSHAFHVRCIEPWFRRVSTFPTCRRDATIPQDAVVDEVGLETGEGNGDGAPVQIDRPVRARRQPARLADYSLA